ncbi:MAG: hypothetical protein Salg2KO_04580 [Salibacteraceae bacterium]
MKNNAFNTLSQATQNLHERGYTQSFKVIDENTLESQSDPRSYSPDEIAIVEFHRFEGSSNPSDMSVVYALEADGGQKGILIDAFGADAAQDVGRFLKRVEDRSK